MMPLIEAKMIHLYDTKWATYDPDGSTRDVTEAEKAEHQFAPLPRYWVHEAEIDKKLAGRWDKPWFLGWRDICRATDVRTVIASALPRVGYGDKLLLALPAKGREELQAAWSSFVFDFAARQKIGGTSMKYFTFMQLPMLVPEHLHPWNSWIGERVDRLNGWVADPEVRSRLRAELDALMFHLYGVAREDVDYILETFPIVKRKDVAAFGEFRTKRLILEAYDELAKTATRETVG